MTDLSLSQILFDAYKQVDALSTDKGAARNVLDKINTLSEMTRQSQLWSRNEDYTELSSQTLCFVLLDAAKVVALQALVVDRTSDFRRQRRQIVMNIIQTIQSFLDTLDALGIPYDKQKSHKLSDAAQERDRKITLYKKEKQLKERLPKSDQYGRFEFMSRLDEDTQRTYCLDLCMLMALELQSLLNTSQMELDMLSQIPDDTTDAPETQDTDSTWRLDPSPAHASSSPLLDSSGRPQRPFVIVPSAAAGTSRVDIQNSVFRPSWNLPTMSVDEYLDKEAARGGIIPRGQGNNTNEPTTREKRQIRMEMDGTMDAEVADDEHRQETEKWARYTESHRKGEGNMHNRG